MNKLKLYLLTSFLLIAQGCSLFIENENEMIKNISFKNSRPIEELYCSKNTSQLLSKNGKFLPKNIQITGNIAEQIVQQILLEIYFNPDSITDRSKIQIFYKTKNALKYYETRDNNQSGLLSQLSQFLTLEKSSKTLQELNQVILSKIPSNLLATHSLAKFLANNKIEISQNPILASLFLKGDDTLAPFETFKKMPMIIAIKNEGEKSIEEKALLRFDTDNNNISCNFNLAQIQEFTSSLTRSENTNAYYFGKQINSDEMFVVLVSSNITKPLETIVGHYMLKGERTKETVPFCFQMKDHKFIFTASTEGRDPAQHLSHYLDYGLFESENIIDLIGHMKFTRHLFLKNPDRLLFESLKARPEQLSFYYTMNIPLYHMDKIGHTIFWGQFSKRKETSFVIDERGLGEVRCQ